jgi:hypothetical protein
MAKRKNKLLINNYKIVTLKSTFPQGKGKIKTPRTLFFLFFSMGVIKHLDFLTFFFSFWIDFFSFSVFLALKNVDDATSRVTYHHLISSVGDVVGC